MKTFSMFKILITPLLLISLSTCNPKSSDVNTSSLNEDLISVADSISKLMNSYHYNPSELKTDLYLKLETKVQELAQTVKTKQDFIDAYNELWKEGPFSHVSLSFIEKEAKEMADYIDSLRVGDQAVSLTWLDQTAVLTVNTMTGLDTKEQVFEAYIEIKRNHAESLIIDLRSNTGGTFAGVPLISHLLTDSVDAGTFVSQKWWNRNDEAPRYADVQNLPSWHAWSIKSFWNDVQEQELTPIRFSPMEPHFSGPTYVLVSSKTASAAEFSADALKHRDNVILIGERTAGEMLSQRMYDLPHGFQISLPIADYYSHRIGRIEGNGVLPDIEINQRVAKDIALSIIAGESVEDAIAGAEEVLNELKTQPLGDKAIYLLGSMNDWGQNLDATREFEYKGQGIYETFVILKEGEYEFKIAPIDWSFDFGANKNQEKVGIGKENVIVKVPKSKNLEFTVVEESKLVFRLNLSDEQTTTIRIVRG